MTSNVIVTTTIHSPTEAIARYANLDEWDLIVVGDLSTPHDEYTNFARKFPKVTYLSPEYQHDVYRELSDAIGWRCIQRRSIGFVEAYRRGARVVATVDDDNIPYDTWGRDLTVGRTIEVDLYDCEARVFDPLAVTEHRDLWHRGYPVQLLQERHSVRHVGRHVRSVLVQADLWDGDPDVDSIARIAFRPTVNFGSVRACYASTRLAPFNSQNTFISRTAIPHYALFPHVGRMDDIWAGFLLQHRFPDSVVFGPPSVFHQRNDQDLVQNLEDELLGYRRTIEFLDNLDHPERVLPEKAMRFYEVYQSQFDGDGR